MTINSLDTTGGWAINGEAIYTPSSNIKIEHDSYVAEDSGRTESGGTVIEWIKTDLVKVYFAYKVMTASELDFMLDKVQGKVFNLTFKDRGKKITRQMYCSKSSYTFYTSALGNEDVYRDVSFNCIEM